MASSTGTRREPDKGAKASPLEGTKLAPARRVPTWVAWVVGLILLALVCYMALFMGAATLTRDEVWGSITHKLGIFASDNRPAPSLIRQSILFDLRIPRIVMGIFVGAGLAVAGASLQAITRNDLAEPYLLGVSYGASTGAVVALLLMPVSFALGLTGGAAIGALLSFGLLMLLLRGTGFVSTRVVLTGVLVGQFFSAITSLILVARGDAESVRGITFWLLGAMGASRVNTMWIVLITVVITSLLIWMMSRYLDAMSFGDETAKSMGVPVVGVRASVLILVALMTAATVSAVGAIGFIGLLVPHAVRMIVGSSHARLIPLSALVGAILLVFTDALARSVFQPQEVPVGVFTALLGVPLFFFILNRGQRV